MHTIVWVGRLWFPEVSQAEAYRALLAQPGGLTPEDDARRRTVVRFATPDADKIRMPRGEVA